MCWITAQWNQDRQFDHVSNSHQIISKNVATREMQITISQVESSFESHHRYWFRIRIISMFTVVWQLWLSSLDTLFPRHKFGFIWQSRLTSVVSLAKCANIFDLTSLQASRTARSMQSKSSNLGPHLFHWSSFPLIGPSTALLLKGAASITSMQWKLSGHGQFWTMYEKNVFCTSSSCLIHR